MCVKEKVWDLRHLSQKRKILKYLSNNKKYEKEYLFLKNNRLSPYLYEYTKNYNWKEVDIKFDNDERPFYLYKNKRMYFKKSMKVEHIKKYVKHTANHQAQYDFSYKGLHHVKGTKSHDLSGSASDSGRNQETEG